MQHTVKSSKQRFTMGSARYANFGLVGVESWCKKRWKSACEEEEVGKVHHGERQVCKNKIAGRSEGMNATYSEVEQAKVRHGERQVRKIWIGRCEKWCKKRWKSACEEEEVGKVHHGERQV